MVLVALRPFTSAFSQPGLGISKSLTKGNPKMNNKKCRFCGFINFIEAEACRKCEAMLDAPGHSAQTQPGQPAPGYTSPYNYQYQYQPPAYNRGISTMAKVLVVVGAVIVVSIGLTVAMAAWSYKKHSRIAWQEFRPGEPGLSVMMPAEPTALDPIVTPTQMGEIKNYPYTAVVSGQGMTMFCIVSFPFSFVDYPRPDKVLDAELDSLMKRTNSTLISKRSLNEGETKGLAFDFQTKGNLRGEVQKGFGKLVLGGTRLYLLYIVASENSELLEGRDKFLNATLPY
jgi:hypothetical protein